ncbi:hypothetical protein STENM36S_06307 [Streptomyces tendae]
MSDTSILNQTLIIGSDPDEVTFEVHEGHAFILLGPVSIALPLTAQAAVDKLATVAAQAAADNRARRLREVA